MPLHVSVNNFDRHMKKIFSLLAAMSTALCATATDLTFDVEVCDNIVTVTPSVSDELYYCAAVDEETIDYFTAMSGRDVNNPQDLFIIATGFYPDNLFTGVSSQTLHSGNHVLVMCGAEQDEVGTISATGEIVTMPLIIGSGDDEPELEPLTFTIECDNDGFTVTPSDDIQEYATAVFPQFMVEQLASIDRTIDSYMEMMADYGLLFGLTNTGTSYHTLEEYAEEGDEIVDGLYFIAVMGVRPDGSRHVITTSVYQYEWLIDHTTTDLHDIVVSARKTKMFKDGKFIVGGRVLLDGTLVR